MSDTPPAQYCHKCHNPILFFTPNDSGEYMCEACSKLEPRQTRGHIAIYAGVFSFTSALILCYWPAKNAPGAVGEINWFGVCSLLSCPVALLFGLLGLIFGPRKGIGLCLIGMFLALAGIALIVVYVVFNALSHMNLTND